MSSGLWKKNDEPGIFGGGHKKGLWSSGQDIPGPSNDPMMDGDLGWDKLEKEYYEDFDRRNANPVDQRYNFNHEDHQADKNQAENISHSNNFRDIEEAEDQKTPDNSTDGTPYREEELKVTDIRRGGHKRLTDLISTRFSKRLINRPLSAFSRGSKAPPDINPVNCPEKENGCANFRDCLQCSRFQDWEQKGEGNICEHEYKERKYNGYIIDPDWEKHPGDYHPEVYRMLKEEKCRIEEQDRAFELERQKMAALYRELQQEEKCHRNEIDKEEMETDEDDFDGDNDHDYNCNYDYDDEEDLY